MTRAEQGDPDAQYEVGVMYAYGKDVRQDYAKTKTWFEKAAAQGHSIVQFNLGVLYYNGQGGQQNVTVAKEWFGKACDNGLQVGCDSYTRLNR